MDGLLILGTGPHAVEIADIVRRINREENRWDLIGFVSAWGGGIGEELVGLPILGEGELEQYPAALVVPEYDWPRKRAIPRERLATIIDPSVFVSRTAQIGAGCVIYPNCYVGAHARIGDLLFCLGGTVINHNDVIEDRVTLTSSVTIAGDVHIEADCYLGQACTVREMLRIGRGSLLGMGSVVIHTVAPNSVMAGNPARRLRAREPMYPGAKVVAAIKRDMGRGARAARRAILEVTAST